MLETIKGYWTLRWTPQRQFHPLPSHITRSFINTPGGEIELLISEPQSLGSEKQSPAIFFIHGGCGSASVWLEWMTHLSQHYNARTYAYSMRNHGASYVVPYLKMVWGTSLDELASDLVAAVKEAQKMEQGRELIFVAHSSGGGLSQYVLSQGLVKARALALVGAVPHFGNIQVYVSWMTRIDPWFSIRQFFHFFHPNSILCTPKLVYNAFFGPEYTVNQAAEFLKWMAPYESMRWPLGMGGRGWGITGRVWLQPVDILKNIVDWTGGSTKDQDKIVVMIGGEDKIMKGTEERLVKEYREGIQQLSNEKKIDVVIEGSQQSGWQNMNKYVKEIRAGGVRLVEVKNAGHHTQNDAQYAEAAESLRRFAEQA